MSARDNTADYRALFLQDTPLIDVRAPIEFEKGAFPNSVNVPLLDDSQREAVGTRYKTDGQDAAIELGWSLATEDIKAQRVQDWQHYTKQFPQGYLYCFRGGLRSRLSQQLLTESGTHYPYIEGGYKAMRRFLIDELEALSTSTAFICIGGRTCSGKTVAIKALENAIDLEGLAHHRGSAFGRHITEQPSQINFENALSIALLKLSNNTSAPVFVEDESKLIGRLCIPPMFLDALRQAPMVVVDTPIEERIELAIEEYITQALPDYRHSYGDQAINKLEQDILSNLARIQKRLGGDRHSQLLNSFKFAFHEYRRNQNLQVFAPGTSLLLTDYYDPMYDYQFNKRQPSVHFKGSVNELLEWSQHAQYKL